MKLEKLTIGILAGGKSSRMGSNKAELKHSGGSFLEYILKQTEGFAERLVSVDGAEKYHWLLEKCGSDLKLVEDEYKEFGPVEGIYQLLKNMKTEACLVTATDMPCLSRDFFQSFAGQYEKEACLVLKSEGRVEPLCSIYGRACIPVLKNFRAEGIHKPRLLFEKVHTRFISIEELGYAPSVVNNINTPGEYLRFLEENIHVH